MKKPGKGDWVTYEGQRYCLTEEPVRETESEAGIGCSFSADARQEDSGEIFRIQWLSTPVYDVLMQKVEAERRSVDLCEYVPEEELYRQAGAEKYYQNEDEICNWKEPFRVTRR